MSLLLLFHVAALVPLPHVDSTASILGYGIGRAVPSEMHRENIQIIARYAVQGSPRDSHAESEREPPETTDRDGSRFSSRGNQQTSKR